MELLYRVFCVVYLLFQIVCYRGLTLCDILVYSQDPPRLIEEEFRDMPAKFGEALSLEGFRGFVVMAEPAPDGCQKLNPPPTDDNFTGKWVVLIARYNCSFETKIRNAQNAGFDAVIVHNVNSSDLEVMSAKNPAGIKIPSVFVSEETGFIIENNYLFNYRYFVVINGELPFNINTNLLLPFAVVVGLSVIIMIIFMIVKCVKDRRRARRHRLPYNALKKIPTCKYTKGDPYDTCAICLDDYLEGDKLRVLPCAHAYHCKCIDPWLTKNRRVCPVCKRRVFAAGEGRHRGRRADAEEPHTGHSSSETDDDRTPLVYPRNNVTQGGTFQQEHVENSILTALRNEMRFIRDFSERSDNATNQERTEDGSPTKESQCSDCDDTSTDQRGNTRALTCGKRDKRTHAQTMGSSCPENVSDRRPNVSPANPFLTGVLNMRGDHFAMTRDDDGQTMPSQASGQPEIGTDDTEALLSHERSRESKNKDKKQSSRNKKMKSKRSRALSVNDAQGHHSGDNDAFVVDREGHSINAGMSGDDVEDDINRHIGVAALPNMQFVQPNRQPANRKSNNFNL